MITASRPGRGSTRASPARKGLVTTSPSRSRVNGAIPAINPRYTPNASPFSSQTLATVLHPGDLDQPSR